MYICEDLAARIDLDVDAKSVVSRLQKKSLFF